jgi:hypothetical protein
MIYSFPAGQDRPQTLRATSEQYCHTEQIWRLEKLKHLSTTLYRSCRFEASGEWSLLDEASPHFPQKQMPRLRPPARLRKPVSILQCLTQESRSHQQTHVRDHGGGQHSHSAASGVTLPCLDVRLPNSSTRCSFSTTYNEHLQPHCMLILRSGSEHAFI